MIVFESVSKRYRGSNNFAVNSLDLILKEGEILGFAGLNGAGKTTTIRMAAGISTPTNGRILVDGIDIVREKIAASRNIGFVPEFPDFEPNAKPIPLMVYYSGYFGIFGKKARENSEGLLNFVGLGPALDVRLRNYSQGMKKRFSIAVAMINSPSNYLMDETLTGLDPEGLEFFKEMLLQLRDEGKSILLSSHILSELEYLADRVAIINKGRLIKTLSKNEIRSLGKSTIEVRLENFDERAISILSKYGSPKKSGGTIIVTDLAKNAHMANSDLASNGYVISKFEIKGQSLEKYFVELVGKNETNSL